MLDAVRSFLTTDSAEWYETLPFVVGSVFVGIELIVLIAKGESLHYYAPRLGYMLSEGIAVCILPMYGVALAFNRSLALTIAEKNSKVLAVAMLVAFATLIIDLAASGLSHRDLRTIGNRPLPGGVGSVLNDLAFGGHFCNAAVVPHG